MYVEKNTYFCNSKNQILGNKQIITMYLTQEKKQQLFEEFGKATTNTGSPESQVALFTYRINHLTEHLRMHKKDFSTQRSLMKLVGKRRSMLDYLKHIDIERYRSVIKALNLRK